jgi:hypothetical protein
MRRACPGFSRDGQMNSANLGYGIEKVYFQEISGFVSVSHYEEGTGSIKDPNMYFAGMNERSFHSVSLIPTRFMGHNNSMFPRTCSRSLVVRFCQSVTWFY